MHNNLEIKKFDLIIHDNFIKKQQNHDFVDLSLDSDDEVKVKEWIEFRGSEKLSNEFKSFHDSYGMMSALMQLEKNYSVYSRYGSIVESFSVNLNLELK